MRSGWGEEKMILWDSQLFNTRVRVYSFPTCAPLGYEQQYICWQLLKILSYRKLKLIHVSRLLKYHLKMSFILIE